MRMLVVLALVAACDKADEATFAASCGVGPEGSVVACTVENQGTKAARACLTVRLDPPKGRSILGPRACTGVLARREKTTLKPRFDLPTDTCRTKDGAWQCKVSVVETSTQMDDNVPPAKP